MQKAKFRKEKMLATLKGDASNATDLADYLAKHGLPFREAHEIVGRIVRFSLANNCPIEDLSLEQLKEFHPLFTNEALEIVKHIEVMKARTSYGGTAPSAVSMQIERAKQILALQ
jgi:argininosuccinate lyase